MKTKNKIFWIIVSILFLTGIVLIANNYSFNQSSQSQYSAYSVISSSSGKADPSGVKINNKSNTYSVAVSCTPDSGFTTCDGYTNTYLDATATVYLHSTLNLVGTYKQGYYVGAVSFPAKVSGTSAVKLYYVNNPASDWNSFWNSVSCGQNGCSGNQVSNTNTVTLATPGQEFKGCPVYYAWAGTTTPNAWSAVWAGRGWIGTGNCIDVKSVTCVDNADCGTNQYCDTSGTWQQWSCKIKQCDTGQEQCTGTSYSQCVAYNWVNKGKVLGKCGVQCLADTSCQNLNNETGNFCSNNQVVKTLTSGKCNIASNQCEANQNTQVLQTCKFGCTQGTCFEDTSKFKILIYVAISVALLIVLAIIYLVIRRKRRK